MANITLTVIIEKLENDELNAMDGVVEKLLVKATQDGQLAGKISEVTELDREEDDVDEDEESDE
jgi:hypothetical protein